jgi:hypothetical protein
MITPVLVLDSHEDWLPVSVDKSLAPYGYTWDGVWVREGEAVSVIDFPPDMKPPDLPPVLYHRVAEGGDLYWHQLWGWWPYNPKKYPPGKRGVGDHEGDWEMVQFGCKDAAGDHPVLATYSQHGGCEKKEYWRVTLDDDKHPLVYVARDSHANYFNQERDVTDTADGKGEHLHPEVCEFPEWHKWMGRWGNSVNSPGPLTPRRAWRAPHAYHAQGR